MRRMEELSSSTLSLDEVDDVIQDEAMWRDFIDVSDKLGGELPVSTREMNACTIMMATLLTFHSWQQPGAVANATLAEYKNRTEVRHEGETVTIIKVAEHNNWPVWQCQVRHTPPCWSAIKPTVVTSQSVVTSSQL